MAQDENTNDFVFVATIASARAGNAAGFDRLYERFASSVHLLGVLECYSEPETLVDVVLSKAFGEIRSFVGSEPAFAGNLFRLAFDQIIEERTTLGLEVDEHVSCRDGSFHAEGETGGMLRLHDSLHWLSDQERRLIHLRVTFNLNLLQAARVLGCDTHDALAIQSSIERTLADADTGSVSGMSNGSGPTMVPVSS